MKKLLGSYLVTTVCSWTLAFLVPLYVLEITNSATWTSLTYFAAMAPYILVTPFAGVWSDRYNKKRFLIGGDMLSTVVAVLLVAAVNHMNGTNLALMLIILAFLLASIAATHHPMFQSIAPEILEPDNLKRFNSIVNAIDNIVRIVAPIFVAMLMTITSKETIMLYCGAGFLLSMPILLLLPSKPFDSKVKHGIFSELAVGVRYVLQDANLVSFSTLFFCVNFGLALINANLVYIFSSLFGVAQEGIGYYFGVISIGAIMGSLMAPKLIGRFEDAAIIIRCCAMAGVLALLACFATSPLVYSLIWAVSTACQSIVVVTFFTFRQKVVPKELLGRTVGVTRLISYLAIPPASLLGGVLMDRTHSSVVIMATGGLAIIAGSLLALRAPAFQSSLFDNAATHSEK